MFVLSYAQRLADWASVVRHVRGVTAADQATLRSAIWRAPLSSLGNFGQWQYPMVQSDCFVSTDVGRFFVRARSDDLFQVLPSSEPEIVKHMKQTLRPGHCFVDAGANIGVLTILASQLVGPTGQVVAIEMMPETAAMLRKHVAENDCRNVRVVEAALSDTAGLTVRATAPHGKSGQASIVVDQPGQDVEVRTATLGDILEDVGQVHILKLDVEGAELKALMGLAGSIAKIDSILYEDRGLGPSTTEWLEANGFAVRRIDRCNSLAFRGLA